MPSLCHFESHVHMHSILSIVPCVAPGPQPRPRKHVGVNATVLRRRTISRIESSLRLRRSSMSSTIAFTAEALAVLNIEMMRTCGITHVGRLVLALTCDEIGYVGLR